MIEIDKKWKYLQFFRDTDSYDGWSFECSDEPSGVSRDRLLSALEVFQRTRAENFSLIFNAIASDPQLIECRDGLYKAFRIDNEQYPWAVYPVYFNREMWKQFSHYIRTRRRHGRALLKESFLWMNVCQLELAKILMVEALGVSDTFVVDELLAYKKEEMFE